MNVTHDDRQKKQQANKLEKRIRRNAGKAIIDFKMIADGDRVMVCLSGGKDSYAMLEVLLHLQKTAPISFEILAVNLDQKQPGFPEHVLPTYLESKGVPYFIIEEDTYSIVKSLTPEGKSTCSLCSRLRRGNLYSFAKEHQIDKIALGHHRDDIVETLFLNMFYGGQLKAMPPKLLSDDGENIVIRPLAYCKEADIAAYAELKAFPIIPCNLCGSQENLQRQVIKGMLNTWESQHPGRIETIFKSIQSLKPSQLADRTLFDFEGLSLKGRDMQQASSNQDELTKKTQSLNVEFDDNASSTQQTQSANPDKLWKTLLEGTTEPEKIAIKNLQ